MQDLVNQALGLHRAGRLEEAEAIYKKVLAEEPKHPAALARLAILLGQKNLPIESFNYFTQAIEVIPNEFDLLVQGADIAAQAGENQAAEAWLSKAIVLNPNEPSLKEKLVGVFIGNHKEKQALELVKEVIKLNPQSANAYNLKGLALCRLGDTDKGYKGFQKAVKMNPGQLGALRNLLTYGKGKKEPLLDQIVPQLEQQLRQPNMAPATKLNVAYIVSMYYDKQKMPQQMFKYLKLGNDLTRNTYQYQHQDTVALFEQMKQAFSPEFIKFCQGKGLDDVSPIFILGMPRSGTTLIEQILSSHSKVEAEGEITDLNQALEDQSAILFNPDTSNEDKLAACIKVGEAYLAAVRSRNNAPMFTDKLPYNFISVGAIAVALPNAKIIHCTRDALETCFSIYKQNFSGAHMYKNDLKELGQYYKAYEDLMAYWNEVLPDQVYEASYEKMVDYSESEIPTLVERCGLEMEAACLGFHKNKRAVRTASVAQVRQPIYKDAKKASTPYKDMLAPLVDALQA